MDIHAYNNYSHGLHNEHELYRDCYIIPVSPLKRRQREMKNFDEKSLILGLTLGVGLVSVVALIWVFATFGIDPNHVYFSFF